MLTIAYDVDMATIEVLGPTERQAILDAAELEVQSFSDWFVRECKEEPLIRFEKAILKTYLTARLSGRFPSVQEDSQTSVDEALDDLLASPI